MWPLPQRATRSPPPPMASLRNKTARPRPPHPHPPPVRARRAGVDFAVVVHPEPYQDDHDYLEHCLEVGQGKLKGTCLFFAGRSGSLDRMAALVKRCPGVVAARIHAYAPERLPPFGKPELRE